MQKREKGTTAQIEDEGADTHPDAALSYAEYSHALAFIQLLGDGRWAPPAGRHFHFYLQACRSPRHPALHVDSNFTKKCSRLLLSQSRVGRDHVHGLYPYQIAPQGLAAACIGSLPPPELSGALIVGLQVGDAVPHAELVLVALVPPSLGQHADDLGVSRPPHGTVPEGAPLKQKLHRGHLLPVGCPDHGSPQVWIGGVDLGAAV
eukprot:scaffold11815_cov146-Isochrysis_galbana.AAC.1